MTRDGQQKKEKVDRWGGDMTVVVRACYKALSGAAERAGPRISYRADYTDYSTSSMMQEGAVVK